jgi:hypothetical protein
VPPSKTPLPHTATDAFTPAKKTSTILPPTVTGELPFVLVRVESSQGRLSDLLASEVKKAEALGFTPVVYFDATW